MNRGSMRNYGPAGYLWELWHEGPVRDRENIILVHGYRLPLSALPGRCDEQFGDLDRPLRALGCEVDHDDPAGQHQDRHDQEAETKPV